MPGKQSAEFIMPVGANDAAMQFFIEAMKANTAVLERVGKSLEGVQAEQKEVLRLVHAMDARLVRIESNRVDRRVEALEQRVDKLEATDHRRDGAATALSGLWKNLPSIAAVVVAVVAMVLVFLKASGRLP